LVVSRIELHIEELVLHGVPEADREAIGHALQDRLTALLAAHSPEWRDRPRVDAGRFLPGATPRQIGERIATAVHQGLLR
jgi:hypothetical protein